MANSTSSLGEPDWQEVLGIYKGYRDDLPYLMHLAYVRGVADTSRKETERTSEYLALNGNKLLTEVGALIDRVGQLMDRLEKKNGK